MFQGNVFARCRTCSRELFRDPKTNVWRGSRADDHRPRELTLFGDMPVSEGRRRKSRPDAQRNAGKDFGARGTTGPDPTSW